MFVCCVISCWVWHTKKMADLREQHINIIFALNRGKNTMKAYEMLDVAFEDQTTEIKQVFQVQKKCDLCWRCQVHRVSTSEKNRWKCVSSDGTSTQKQSVSMKLLTCWEFYVNSQYFDSLNMPWIAWNSCTICWVKSRRFMSPYPRTITRGLKNTQNTFHW